MAKNKQPWYRKHYYLVIGVMTAIIYLPLLLTMRSLEQGSPVPMDDLYYLNAIHALPLIALVLIIAGLALYKSNQ